jgi:hypothetical protein
MTNTPHVGVVIVSYQSEDVLPACLTSVLHQAYPRVHYDVIVIDNASCDHSVELVRENFPDVHLEVAEHNSGFAAGANRGIRYCREHSYEYIVLLNPDTQVDRQWLGELVAYMQAQPQVGMAQSLVYLGKIGKKINSIGNATHYLGFGFCPGFGEEWSAERIQKYVITHPVGFVSGASCIIYSAALHKTGVFDEDYFMYMEDVDLSLRMLLTGYKLGLCPHACVWHDNTMAWTKQKYYLLERNRVAMIMTLYQTKTLILLLPALIAMECGMLVFSFMRGWLIEKVKSYWYVVSNLRSITHKRREIRKTRQLSDHELMQYLSGSMHYSLVQSWLWEHIGNPLFASYFYIIRRCL